MKRVGIYLATTFCKMIAQATASTKTYYPQGKQAANSKNFRSFKKVTTFLTAFVVIAVLTTSFYTIGGRASGSVSLTAFGSAYTQNFDTLANTGTSSTVPTGWDFSEVNTNASTTYSAGTGSDNTGDTYSFGSTSSTERAFGGLQSGTLIPTIGASFTNNIGGTIASLAISYTGEQWRLGATGRVDRLDFQYSTNATSLTTGTWTAVDALDFTAPITSGTVGALNGNSASNRTAISSTIINLSISNGTTFWIRWNDLDATGADDGLGVDDFSLTPGSGPTNIDFVSGKANHYLKANNTNGGTLVQWQTGMEVANLGFYIYREEGGKLNRVTPDLIAGSAIFAGANTVLRAGRNYAWRDPQPLATDTRYFIEEVDLNGLTQMYGPIYADSSNTIKQFSAQDREPSMLMSEMNQSANSASENYQSAQLETTARMAKLTPARIEVQATVNAKLTAKLSVNKEGWYRITQPELVAAGFNLNAGRRFLQLFVDGQEVPLKVTGDRDGRFAETDAIEFYGVGLDTPFTNSRAYFLVADSQSGRRITEVTGSPGSSSPESFPYTVERKDRTIYFSSLKNGAKENFFGAVIARNPLDQTLTLTNLAPSVRDEAMLEVGLQGVTLVQHSVQVLLNDIDLGIVEYEWQEEGTAKFFLPQSLLREGQNTVRLIPLGGNTDVSLVSFLRLTYQHKYSAENDALRFTASGTDRLTIDGFSNKNIQVFDVTDQSSTKQVAGQIEESGAGYSISFNAPETGLRQLLAFAAGQVKKPVATLKQPSNLRDRNQKADYLIITRSAFIDSLKPLIALRESQRLSVAVVDIETIYDDFSFGQKTPQAVRDFLSYTRSQWNKSPTFLLLAADATYDPRDYLQRGNFDIVPTKLVDTAFLESASDDWFADFNNDGIPEIATGRLPARTPQELALFVSKIINYERSAKNESAIMVADQNNGYNFENEMTQLKQLFPTTTNAELIFRGQMGSAAAKARLLDKLNQGQKIVNYAGHGSVDLWAGSLFTGADARALTNGSKLSVFVMTSCLNGYFHDPVLDSLGEALMKAENGGAIAVWASSALTFPQDQAVMNQKFHQLLFTNTLNKTTNLSTTLGEAAARAKASIQNTDIRRSWILFGDPALRLK